MKVKALIVDDERIARESLKAALNEFCPDVEISGIADSAQSATQFLKSNPVDVVFTDIQMPLVNGIDFIRSIPDKKFKVVFVTAYNTFAIKAIRAFAFDYLLKPIDEKELIATISRLMEELHKTNEQQAQVDPNRMNDLIRNLKLGKNIQRVTIPHSKGYKVLDTDDIILLEGNNNYTNFHLADGSVLIATRTMKEFEKQFDAHLFYRPHKSFIINLYHFREFIYEDGGYAVMSNKYKVPVARGKGPELLERINQLQ